MIDKTDNTHLANALMRQMAAGIELGAYAEVRGGKFSPFVSSQCAAIIDLLCSLFPGLIERHLEDHGVDTSIEDHRLSEIEGKVSFFEGINAKIAGLQNDNAELTRRNENQRQTIEKMQDRFEVIREVVARVK